MLQFKYIYTLLTEELSESEHQFLSDFLVNVQQKKFVTHPRGVNPRTKHLRLTMAHYS